MFLFSIYKNTCKITVNKIKLEYDMCGSFIFRDTLLS